MKLYTYSPTFDFDVLVKKAYGYHGNRVRERKRFPRRHILTRIIKMEEEKAIADVEFDKIESVPRPVGLMEEHSNVVLARDAQRRSSIAKWLPMSLRLTKMDLIYSSNLHGRTLERFYTHVKSSKQTLTIIECLNNGAVIGMFASQAWTVSHEVYGDGECFLFRLDPQPEGWKWKPDKSYQSQSDLHSGVTSSEDEDDEGSANKDKRSLIEQFMVGRETFISMGGNDSGTCGLRLNEDLTKGESAPAKGYNNEPLPFLKNFEVGLVEVYRLVRAIDGKTSEQYNAEQFTRTSLR